MVVAPPRRGSDRVGNPRGSGDLGCHRGQNVVVALRHCESGADGAVSLARVDPHGGVTVGPRQPGRDHHQGCLAGTPLRLFRGPTIAEVRPDLTLGPAQSLPYHPFYAGSVGGVGSLVWIVGQPPNRTGAGG